VTHHTSRSGVVYHTYTSALMYQSAHKIWSA